MLAFLLLPARIVTQPATIISNGVAIPTEQFRAMCAANQRFHLVIGERGQNDHLVSLFYGGPDCTVEVWSTALQLKSP